MPDPGTRVVKRALLSMAAIAAVATVRLLLTVASHRTVLSLMPRGRTRTAHPRMAIRIGVAVTAASRLVPGASCLTQALAAQLLLALRGCSSDVRIGVKVGAGQAVEAHAWLVSGAITVVGGTPEEIAAYVPMTDLARESR